MKLYVYIYWGSSIFQLRIPPKISWFINTVNEPTRSIGRPSCDESVESHRNKWNLRNPWYPLVNKEFAIENGHRNS
jgi:hypothetical protein